jgi:hypothetical protein
LQEIQKRQVTKQPFKIIRSCFLVTYPCHLYENIKHFDTLTLQNSIFGSFASYMKHENIPKKRFLVKRQLNIYE